MSNVFCICSNFFIHCLCYVFLPVIWRFSESFLNFLLSVYSVIICVHKSQYVGEYSVVFFSFYRIKKKGYDLTVPVMLCQILGRSSLCTMKFMYIINPLTLLEVNKIQKTQLSKDINSDDLNKKTFDDIRFCYQYLKSGFSLRVI